MQLDPYQQQSTAHSNPLDVVAQVLAAMQLGREVTIVPPAKAPVVVGFTASTHTRAALPILEIVPAAIARGEICGVHPWPEGGPREHLLHAVSCAWSHIRAAATPGYPYVGVCTGRLYEGRLYVYRQSGYPTLEDAMRALPRVAGAYAATAVVCTDALEYTPEAVTFARSRDNSE